MSDNVEINKAQSPLQGGKFSEREKGIIPTQSDKYMV